MIHQPTRFLTAQAAALITLAITTLVNAADDTTPKVRIARFAGDRAAAISYTFDDNLRDQYKVAVPMLNEAGFKGTFFVIAGRTAGTPAEGEQKDRETEVRKQWGGISWPELKELADQGHEIGSHTWSHRDMGKLPPDEVAAELLKACEEIGNRTGKPPLTVAFPFNQSTPEVQAAALKYHVAYRSHQLGLGARSTTDSLNAWADKLIAKKEWGVVMAHAIAHGYAALSDPQILRAHLRYVKGREREIWVDTFANIARYEKERDGTKLGTTGKPGSITCVLSCGLDSRIYQLPLTLVIDAAGATTAGAMRAGQELPARVEKDVILVEAPPGTEPVTITWK